MIRRWIVFSCEKHLFIEYAPRFKLHKCPPEFPHPAMMNAHHPYFLDFYVDEVDEELALSSNSYRLDEKPKYKNFEKTVLPKHISQNDNDMRVFEEIIFLINALTDHHVFQYEGRQAWTVALSNDEKELRFSQEFYDAPDFDEPKEIAPQKNYLGEMLFTLSSEDGNLLKLVRLNDLLDMYYAFSDEEFKSLFLNACLIVDKAKKLSQFEISASYIFFVSAVETLVGIENRGTKDKTCESCGNTQYRVVSKFRNFIDKYGWEVDRKIFTKFYDIRSQISHVGNLLQASYSSNFRPKSQEDLDKIHMRALESTNYESFRKLVKTCFGTFIYANMQGK